MASLWKHDKSKYWVACFTAADGRQLKRSTKTTDSKLALKMANQFEEAWKRNLTESQARRVIEGIYESIRGERLASASLEDFLTRWLARKKMEAKPRTYDSYSSVVRKFLAFHSKKRTEDIGSITSNDIAAFRDATGARLSVGTTNSELKIIRVAFQQAYRDGLIDHNPASRVKTIARREEGVERRSFTVPELDRVLENCQGEWRGLFLFGLYTGQRLKDLATLTWQNVDLQREELRFVSGKTRRRQIIPLARPLLAYITNSLPAGDDPKAPLFPKSEGYVTRTKSGTVGALSQQFHSILAASGLADVRTHQSTGKGRSSKRQQNDLSFHCLRHTATSLMKNAGVNAAVVQDVIGHESSAISANYTHIDENAKRKALDSMPDLFANLAKPHEGR